MHGVRMPLLCVAGLLWGCSKTKVGDGAKDGDFGTSGDTDPVVEITAPVDGQHLYVDTKIRMAGVVTDTPDDPLELDAWWGSDLDGRLDVQARPDGDGLVEGFGYLSEGDHALTLTGVDTSGHVSTTTIIVEVGPPNSVPDCAILYPQTGSGGTPGELVTLTAQVSDPDVASDTLLVLWESDLDGELGTPTASSDGTAVLPIDTLGVGTHVITLTVTDDVGESCIDQVVYGVGEGPQVEILLPEDGAVVAEGESVRLEGTAVDYTTLSDDLELTWTSSRDGVLYSGTPDSDGNTVLDLTSLSQGIHSLVLSATNPLGLSDSDVVSIQVDGRPTQPEVLIGPRPATSDDDLTAIITSPSVDPEGEDIVYSYIWYREGVLYEESTSATVDASATARDEEWRLVVTPSDGALEGTSGEAVTIIQNSAPAVDSVQVLPESPQTGDELTCDYSTSDTDGDAVEVEITWAVNGFTVAVTGDTMDSSWTSKSDVVSCTVTPTDETDDGEALTSGAVIIGNTAPSIAGVRIVPEELYAGDAPTCEYDGYADVDGDADASTIEWSVNGSVVGTGAVLSSPFRKDDVVSCLVTPFDGFTAGTPVSESVTVDNTAPSIESVTMLPWPAYADSTITCTAWGYTDADSDPDDSYVVWSVNGGITAIGGSLTGMFSGGDVVTCAMTPFDGEAEGMPISMTQAISNSTPSITGVRVSPTDAEAGDTLTCESIGYTDIDDDPEASTIVWLVNDFEVGVTSPTLSSGFSGGDRVTCLLTVSDGESSGLTMSDTVTIGNHAPVITDLSFGPLPAATDSILYAEVEAEDEDGDAMSYRYTWFVNGVSVSESGESLDGRDWFERGDEVSLTVTVTDGATDSDPVSVGPTTVENTAPGAPTVQISPTDPVESEDDLWCEVTMDAEDADGDPLSYSVQWFVDGAAFTDLETTSLPDDTVVATHTFGNEEWTCAVTANDGSVDGVAGTDSTSIVPAIGRSAAEAAQSCKDLLEVWPLAPSDVYWIDPTGSDPFEAWCDMDTDGGGWTRIAFAPDNTGVPTGWEGTDAIERDGCVSDTDWCRLSTDTIHAILLVGTETDDRFRLIAEDLPIHTRYYWDTDTAWDPGASDPSTHWWSVALEYGGAHSGGCRPSEASGVGHEPEVCSDGFDHSDSHRVFWYRPDLDTVGADSSSRFDWYAR